MPSPTVDEFVAGYEQYEIHEKRDSMYKVATFLVNHFWGQPADMADGLGVLLLTWNQAFYRYGSFSFDKLERCIGDNLAQIERFRKSDILSLTPADSQDVRGLFLAFLEALQIHEGTSQGKRSPVAAAKALHLLAPSFFPLWDAQIAHAYSCNYQSHPAEKYENFCHAIKKIASALKDNVYRTDRTLVKLIDQYNYSKFTQGWI